MHISVTRVWAGQPRNLGSFPGMINSFILFRSALTETGGLTSHLFSTPRVNQSGRYSDLLPPFRTRVKNKWICTSLLRIIYFFLDKGIQQFFIYHQTIQTTTLQSNLGEILN
jgi:hypothetical protein